MNIYTELNKIVEYIENHLEEKIDYKELAKMVGVNEYTFQKIFSVLCNISLTEYIRNRRLSDAGQELYLKNEKIMNVAVKYQYENATSFSRAFERFHGIKPSDVKKSPENLRIYTKLHFNEINEQAKKIEYKIVEREQLVLYGKYKNTNNQKIKKLAPEFYQEMANKYEEPIIYGMVEYRDKERRFVKAYWIMYDKEIHGLEKQIIPKGKWIMIRIKSQEVNQIQEASDMFYKEFLPVSKYHFKDIPELEYYHDDITDFLIPIED